MSHVNSIGKTLAAAATLVAATHMPSAAVAATPAGCFFGTWMINEQLTKRTRPPRSPLVILYAPWGDNGWVRVSGTEPDSGEFQATSWDGKVFAVFGSDPRSVRAKKVDDFTMKAESQRENQPGRDGARNDSTVSFSKDCKRMTSTRPAGNTSFSGNPDEPDTRVYDKLQPYTQTANDIYGGAWKLNKAASKLTRAPMEPETMILIPSATGWTYTVISGGYQPDDYKAGKKPARAQKPPRRVLYWATWDGKPANTYGADPGQITLKKVDDHHFDIAFSRPHQPWQEGDKGTMVFSNDGKRVTVTRSGTNDEGEAFKDDIRVYEKMLPAEWPGEARDFTQ